MNINNILTNFWGSIKTYLSGNYQPKGSYANSSHTHDDRYYTESEVNTKLSGKSDTSHNHDSTYLGINAKASSSTSADYAHHLSHSPNDDNTNANTYCGNFWSNGSSVFGTTGWGGWYSAFNSANQDFGSQIFVSEDSDRMFFRRLYVSKWYAPLEVIHSGNIGSQSVNYANSAGSASDPNAVKLTGDQTVGGTKTFSSDIYSTNSQHLWFRHLDGSKNGGMDGNLFLNYSNSGNSVYFNGGTYYINGGYYNGAANQGNSLRAFHTDGSAYDLNRYRLTNVYNTWGDGRFGLRIFDDSDSSSYQVRVDYSTNADYATNSNYANSAGSAQPVFNNTTWYLVGDDVKIGDHDVGGGLGLLGNNANTRLDFCQYGNESNYKSITFDGSTLYLDGLSASSTNSTYTYWLRTSSHADHLFHTEWDGTYFWTYVTAGDGGYRGVRVERANSATYADRGYPRRSDGADMNFYWSGQGGQPTWLWGGEDGVNMYVYNPANFSVNYANSSNTSNYATESGHSNLLATYADDGHYLCPDRYDGWSTRLYMTYADKSVKANNVWVYGADYASSSNTSNYASRSTGDGAFYISGYQIYVG